MTDLSTLVIRGLLFGYVVIFLPVMVVSTQNERNEESHTVTLSPSPRSTYKQSVPSELHCSHVDMMDKVTSSLSEVLVFLSVGTSVDLL